MTELSRYILRFRGSGAKPAADVALIRALPNTKVLDDTSRMLLVEASDGGEAALRGIMKSLPNWILTEEILVPLPDPRPRVQQPAVEEQDS